MSEKSRYFRIGLFTMGVLVLLCIGLIMFGAGAFLQEPPIVAETYFGGSVQGLDVGALVKMNGVKVGKVKDILFVKDLYGQDLKFKDLTADHMMVYVKMELESKFFPRLAGKNKQISQEMIDAMIVKGTFRAKLQSIGITGLVYVELGFCDPAETPPVMEFNWIPKELYIPSAPGVATRLGPSLDKFFNKLDTDIYPMIENINKASADLPALTANINKLMPQVQETVENVDEVLPHVEEMIQSIDEVMPHVQAIAKNVEDITATGKKYPSQMIFGDAPPKSRYGQ